MLTPRVRLIITTLFVIAGIAAAALWLQSMLTELWHSRHISSGQICFIHIGQSERPMPSICVTGEARAPRTPDGVVVILSRESLIKFLKLVDQQKDGPSKDRNAFGTYEILNSIEAQGIQHILSKSQMRTMVEQLIGLLDSQQQDAEKPALIDFLRQLT